MPWIAAVTRKVKVYPKRSARYPPSAAEPHQPKTLTESRLFHLDTMWYVGVQSGLQSGLQPGLQPGLQSGLQAGLQPYAGRWSACRCR